MRKAVRVLVADDEGITREMLKAFLETIGYETDGVENGVQGLKAIRENEYAAVISDGDMPSMKGPEFYARACEFRPELRERFIFVTGNPQLLPENVSSPVLPKPVSMDLFIRTVKRVVESNMASENA